MSGVPCPVCVIREADLGQPSLARWIGPDGEVYCSIHFVQAFGHGEKLVRIEGYEPPQAVKAAVPKREKEQAQAQTEVEA